MKLNKMVIAGGALSLAVLGSAGGAWAHHAFSAEFDANAPVLLRGGLTKASLTVGTEVIVRGYQSKDRLCAPACKANGRDITFTDGRKVFMGSSGTGAPSDGSDPTEKKKP